MKQGLGIFLFLLFASTEALGLPYETVKLTVRRKVEYIQGQEFIAANENVVDYLAGLKHPQGAMESFRYTCQVKVRVTVPTIYQTGGPTTTTNLWAQIITVYEIKDCIEVAD